MRLTSFAGLRALVTGASSGIGRALAARLAARGAQVALVARRAGELERLAEEIRAAGGRALPLACDVAARDHVEACATRALAELGGVDLLVNAAGYGHHRPFLEWDVDDMERMLRVNYLGALVLTKALLPQMVDRGRGWLVFVASLAGRIAPPDESAYAASKFAMTGLAESLSLELEPHGVHVLSVFPGVIDTPFFDAEALARMPAVARRQKVPVAGLVDAIESSLRSGRRELTYPRALAGAYLVRALAPGAFRRGVRRATRSVLRG
jgi:short-subunit dehydrogenase